MKNFTERLKDLRTDHDMNQTEIAKKLNVTQRSYSNYETGNTEPKLKTLIDIAKYYGVSTDYILGLTDVPTPYPPAKK